METKIYTITDLERDHEKIVEAAEIIRNGGLVAFPTRQLSTPLGRH